MKLFGPLSRTLALAGLFSVALFFAGMSTRLGEPRLRRFALGVGCTVFLGTVIWLATQPVSIAV